MTQNSGKSDLVPRLVTAVIGIPILLGVALAGPNWGLWLLIGLAATAGTWEYVTMTLASDRRSDGLLAVLAVPATLSVAYWLPGGLPLMAAVFLSVIGLFTAVLFSLRSADEAARRTGAVLTGYLYMAVLFGMYLLLVAHEPRTERGPWQGGWFLLPMFIVWAGDTGAYFAGRALGKHKLFPMVSPGKTWEGAVGGLFASVAGGYLALAVLPLPDTIEPLHVLLYSIPAALIGQIGDLCESMIKRATGFKDSGSIIYGHGGMLDRVDALVFAAPWIYLVKELLQH